MAKGISAFGEKGFSGVFSWENNELHRRMYLADPAKQLFPLMTKLLNADGNGQGRKFPAPFNTFYVFSVTFDLNDAHGAQGETETQGDFSLLDSFPKIRGGLTLDITYRPIDVHDFNPTTEEGWDFSSQTMSMVGNNYGPREQPTNTRQLRWKSSDVGDYTDPPYVTNITSIVKVIPKVELVQRKVWCLGLPRDDQLGCIGQVNNAPIHIGAKGDSGYKLWQPETVLLLGLPTIRRWRFDNKMIFEVGIKLAINVYKAKIEDGSTDFVTWNRLYRHEHGYWDRILCGPHSDDLYVKSDISTAIDGFNP